MIIKHVLFLIFIIPFSIAFANSVGNIAYPATKGNSSTSVKDKKLSINYKIFNYQMTTKEFNTFLSKFSLKQHINPLLTKNIVYLSALKSRSIKDRLNQQFDNIFTDKISGTTQCRVEDNSICGGLASSSNLETSLTIKYSSLFTVESDNNQSYSVNLDLDHIITNTKLAQTKSFKANGLFTDIITNKDYIAISQFSKSKKLFGQIVLVSFDE